MRIECFCGCKDVSLVSSRVNSAKHEREYVCPECGQVYFVRVSDVLAAIAEGETG